MFEKLVALLKTTYANAGLSDAALRDLATELVKTTPTEAELQSAVEGVAPTIKLLQAEFDRMRAAAADRPKPPTPAPKPPTPAPTPAPAPEPLPAPADDTPAWAKALFGALTEKVDAVTSKVAGWENNITVKTRKEQFAAKLATVPDAIKSKLLKDFDKMTFADEDAFTAHLAETEIDLKDFVQQGANTKLGAMGIPLAGTSANANTPATKDEVGAVTKLFR